MKNAKHMLRVSLCPDGEDGAIANERLCGGIEPNLRFQLNFMQSNIEIFLENV